jgi:predicted O-methyltransferase YrrM
MPLNKVTKKVIGFLAYHNFGSGIFLKMELKTLQSQNLKFQEIGLDRNKAISKLNTVLDEIYGTNYTEKNGMWSEHLILFAGLSNSSNKIKKILEIGTFNGETSAILNKLFPESSILTIDLKFDEILKTKMYKYATEGNMLEKNRSANLEFLQNVNFLEMNSLDLINYNQEFDLIWIDGEHTYPTVAIDIANSVRLLSPNGVAICDDVYTETEEGAGCSVASLQTLEALSESKLIKFTLLHKRIGGYFNYPQSNKKYLGYFMKI